MSRPTASDPGAPNRSVRCTCGATFGADDRFCTTCGTARPTQVPVPREVPETGRPPTSVATERFTGELGAPLPADTPPAPGDRSPDDRGRAPLLWGIGALLVVAVAVIALVALVLRGSGQHAAGIAPLPNQTAPGTLPGAAAPPPPPNSPSSGSVDQFSIGLQQMDALLTVSSQARSGVQQAVAAVDACTATSNDVAALSAAADVRRRVIGRLDALPSAVPASLVAELRTAESASLDADQAFAAWGQSQLGCSGSAVHTTDYAEGITASQQATSAKAAFASDWNAVAGANGLPARDPDSL